MSEIVISEIQIIPIKPKDGLVAFASCVLNNQFYIGSIAIYICLQSPGDYRLVFPAKTLHTSKEIQLFYPINTEAYEAIKNPIIQKFKELMEKVNLRD